MPIQIVNESSLVEPQADVHAEQVLESHHEWIEYQSEVKAEREEMLNQNSIS